MLIKPQKRGNHCLIAGITTTVTIKLGKGSIHKQKPCLTNIKLEQIFD